MFGPTTADVARLSGREDLIVDHPEVDRTICGRISDRLAGSVGRERFDRYFRGSARLSLEAGRLAVATPSGFYASWLAANFGASLEEAARGVTLDAGLEVVWRTAPELFEDAGGDASPRTGLPEAPAPRRALGAPRNSGGDGGGTTGRGGGSAGPLRHRLEEFVVGASNSLAYNAAVRLADPATLPGFTSLFLHGECGVGKTHLLQGLAARFLEQRPGAQARYLPAEAFTNEYIAAVRAQKIDAFRAGLRKLDLLCLDDMHFFAQKTGTQNEFLHTFDALTLSGARVALASDVHPRRLAEIHERLVSRCLSGMVAEVELPDAATRGRIVERLALAQGLNLSEAARATIAAECAGSVRDLVGAVARVDAVSRLAPELTASGEIGIIVARRAMSTGSGSGGRGPGASGFGGRARAGVTVAEIVEAVGAALGVEREEMMGRGRHQRVVLARSLAMLLARELTTHSYPEIARAMGRPNHSTVITACQRVRRQIERGEECETIAGRATLVDLCARVRAGLPGRARVA